MDATGQGPGAADRGRALVLGAGGFIGSALVRRLASEGWAVTGLGRSAAPPPALAPHLAAGVDGWIMADLRALTRPDAWAPHLSGVDLVVNGAGVLDETPRDAPGVVHADAILALVAAADTAGVARLIQISAPGAKADATTAFLATKAAGDAALLNRQAGDAVVLRPGLVLGQDAYGGSALLRAIAATPVILPLLHADARAQTVSLDDVAEAAARAAAGALPPRADLPLVEETPRTLREIALATRTWLGAPPPRWELHAPGSAGSVVARLAALALRLGWRTPLSRTGQTVLADGVLADPAPARAALGRPMRSLTETLAALPPTGDALLAARFYPLRILAVITLAAFWIVTGVIALVRQEAAMAVITGADLGAGAARAVVVGGAVADLALGVAVLWRPTARRACLGMVLLTAAYLLGAILLTPGLWLDPLGPLVKAIPAAVLALVTWALLAPR